MGCYSWALPYTISNINPTQGKRSRQAESVSPLPPPQPSAGHLENK
jgi:hypothetical protein